MRHWIIRLILCSSLAQFIADMHAARADGSDLTDAFTQMMMRPNDPEAAFRYAQAAAKAGQVRAAIAALERVLRIDPSLDNIRLELASLYLAAGSPDAAAIYAREALSSPHIPPDVAARAQQLLAQAEQASARSLLTVSIFAGPRWDSNATQATALSSVPVYSPFVGAPVPVIPSITAQSSGSWLTSLQAEHRFDLGLQSDAAWETTFGAFDQRFFSVNHAYNFTLMQLETGPRFSVGDSGSTQLSLRPLVSVNYLAYGDLPYAVLAGGGLSGRALIGSRMTAELTALGRYGNYYEFGIPAGVELIHWPRDDCSGKSRVHLDPPPDAIGRSLLLSCRRSGQLLYT